MAVSPTCSNSTAGGDDWMCLVIGYDYDSPAFCVPVDIIPE